MSMPELGSKINIITKADIRYEGRLFTVDPEKCTIALSHVRSFGTEDRETLNPIPPQNQVYDYIIFRGRDIKDIGYVNTNTLPNDPAIVQMSGPPNLGSSSYQSGYSIPPMMGSMTSSTASGLSQYSSYGAMGVLPGLSTSLATGLGLHDPRSLPKQSELPKVGQPPESTTDNQGSVLDFITGSPRSGTPLPRKSPTMDQGVQVHPNALGPKEEKSNLPPQTRAIQPPSSAARNGYADARFISNFSNRRAVTKPPGQQQQPLVSQNKQPFQPLPQREQRSQEQQTQNRDYSAVLRDHTSTQTSHSTQAPLPQRSSGQHQQNHQPQGQQYRNQQQQQQPQRIDQQYRNQQQQPQRMDQQSNWINRTGGMRRTRPRGQQGGNYNRAPGSGPPPGGKAKTTLKFDNDYDFEQANTEFDKLMSELAKTKITDGENVPPAEGKANGEVEKKDDSGNETGVGEGEADEEHEVFYDKAKSFFDNISCEAIERSKGRSQRTDWRAERKLNSETFGISAARRGGFRGRGYYNNRMGGGGGGMYRQNYRTGYRAPQPGGLRPGMRTSTGIPGSSLMGPVPIVGQNK